MPPGRRKMSRSSSSPSRPRPRAVDMTYEANVVSKGEYEISSWEVIEIQERIAAGKQIETIGDRVKQYLTDSVFYDSQPGDIDLIRVGRLEPYSCSNDGCRNHVAFLVDGKKMCEKHALDEVRKERSLCFCPVRRASSSLTILETLS
jgi:hypothetical protein